MAEGARFPWKVQNVDDSHGPAGDYSTIIAGKPLPDPPKGLTWVHNPKTREWSLEKQKQSPQQQQQQQQRQQQQRRLSTSETTEEVYTAVPVGHVTIHSSSSSSSNNHNNRLNSNNAAAGETDGEGQNPMTEHVVSRTDTLQGICLTYKTTPAALRQANGGVGGNSSLLIVGNKLRIPRNCNGAEKNNNHRRDDCDGSGAGNGTERKIRGVLMAFKPQDGMSRTEARAYLEMYDWNVDEAVENAREDLRWSHDLDTTTQHDASSSS